MLDFVGTRNPQIWRSILPAKILMALSATIILTLGVVHLVYTFWGPMLTPRDPALQISMSQTSPVITKETTMWRCWIGFNATHSIGAYFVRLGLRFFGISTRTTPLPIALSSHRRAGHAWRLCRDLQGVVFRCTSPRSQHCVGLLPHQHCVVAGFKVRPWINE